MPQLLKMWDLLFKFIDGPPKEKDTKETAVTVHWHIPKLNAHTIDDNNLIKSAESLIHKINKLEQHLRKLRLSIDNTEKKLSNILFK